ncbi:MAG TPA: hypothetical protein VM577_08590 [Anaerovoracaceae bacterium]|nr:hypothetical protein [Anaerovoracaceae bacterium]
MVKDDDEDDFHPEHDSEVRSFNFHLLKADNELFNEEANKAQKVTSARRVKLPKNGEDWQILENGKVALLLKGTRFTNAEKTFLRTIDGMKFLVAEYKAGSKSVVKLKEKMKKLI